MNVRTLPLSPLDGFVLSRVDGAATVADIADLTSLEIDVVLGTLEKLVGFDAVEWADGTTSLPSRSVPPPAAPTSSRQGSPKPLPQTRMPAVPMPSPRESAAGGWPMPQSSTPQPAPHAPTPEPVTPRAPTPQPSGPPVKVFGAPPSRSQSGDRFGAVVPRAPSVQMPAVQSPMVTPVPSSLSRPPSVRPPASDAQRDAGMHVHSGREAPLVETFEAKPRQPTSPGTLRPPELGPSEARRPVSVARFPATKVSPRGPTPAPYVPPATIAVSPRGQTPMPGSVPLQRVAVRRVSQVTDATDSGANKAFQEAPPGHEAKPVTPPTPPVVAAPAVTSEAAPPTAPPLAATPVATPAAATEPENDISEEKRKRIDDFYVIADLLDHYQVLGIARTVDRAGVKSAYFELSKVFHPDTAFRKNVGTYRHKMEVIFKRLTESYDVLSKKKLRDEYDAYLARSDQSQTMEETLSGQHNVEELLAQMKAASAPVASPPPEPAPRVASAPLPNLPEPPRAPVPSAAAPSPRAGTPMPGVEERTMSDAAKRRAQELLAKRLDAGRSAAGNTRPLPPPPPPPPPPPKVSKSEVIRELTNSLKHAAQLTGMTHDPIQRQIQDARASMEKGDLSEAVRRYRHVLLLQPDNVELQAEQTRAAQMLAASLADNYAQQALYEERHKKWAAAANSWAKVAEGRPNDAGAHWRSAKALLEANGDVKEAAKLARRAVELAPEDVFAARTLGRAYLAAGMTLNARRELERAVTLDPSDIPTKALLKEIKG